MRRGLSRSGVRGLLVYNDLGFNQLGLVAARRSAIRISRTIRATCFSPEATGASPDFAPAT